MYIKTHCFTNANIIYIDYSESLSKHTDAVQVVTICYQQMALL